MANLNSDIIEGIDKLSQLTENLVRICQLPTEIGSRVRWVHNGLLWERVGGNQWLPIFYDGSGPEDTHLPAPSSHLASYPFQEEE